MLALANSVRLIALSHSETARTCFAASCGLIALCYAVLAVLLYRNTVINRRFSTTEHGTGKAHNGKKTGKYGPSKNAFEKVENTPRQVIQVGVVKAGPLRGPIPVNKDKSKYVYICATGTNKRHQTKYFVCNWYSSRLLPYVAIRCQSFLSHVQPTSHIHALL